MLVFPEAIVQESLRAAGYEGITTERAKLRGDGLSLTRLSLPQGVTIASLRINPGLDVFISGPIDIATPAGPVTLETEGVLKNTGTGWRWQAPLAVQTPHGRADGILAATFERSTRKGAANFEIADAQTDIPDIELKRLTGWVSADIRPGTFPLVSAQLSAGVATAYGATLQSPTLSLSMTEKDMQLLLNGTAEDGSGSVMLDFTAPLSDATEGKGALDLQINLETLKASAKAALAWDPAEKTLAITAADGGFSGHGASLKNVTADLKARLSGPPVLEGSLAAGEIRTPWALPVKLAMTFTPGEAITRISGEITEKNGRLYARLRGRHDGAGKKGNLTLTVPPITLRPDILDLKTLFPFTGEYLEANKGSVGFTGDFNWTEKNINSSGELLLKEFSGTIQDNAFSNISTVLQFSSLLPPMFEKRQVYVGAFDAGLPITDGTLTLSLDKQNTLTLHDAQWTLAGGTLVSSPFTLPLDKMDADVTLTAKGVNLIQLFKLAPLEGLDATGTVGGALPLEIRGGKVTIVDGLLETESKGEIRYNPQEVPAFLQDTEQQQVVDLRVALKAFDYENLKLAINGEAGGEQKIALHAAGKNPEFYGGHPVKINFTVEGPLQSVIKYSLGNNDIPDNLRKQIEAYEKEHAQAK